MPLIIFHVCVGDKIVKRSGKYIENLTGEALYKSFRPSPLPPLPPLEIDENLIKLLVEANRQLDVNANADVGEVINYIKAAHFALERLKTLPICNRLLRETHAVLMEGVRGQEKSPGEFRRSQNWIGPSGSTLKNARYIPPNVEDMENAMSDLEKYINESDKYDPLIQAALIHYQFETIHPFLDGNGRIG